MKFVVFADTHYCTAAGRSTEIPLTDYAHVPDYPRYVPMRDTTLRPLLKLAAQERPDLIISTGDLIEGGADSAKDLQEANALLATVSPEIRRSPGSHDLFPPRGAEYSALRKDGTLLLFLDYTNWDDEQRKWLIAELEKGRASRHIFVFGHAPLHLFGRHFFYSSGFCEGVTEILKQYPVDVYFCGHTHNQTVSRHGSMLQITGSSTGFPHAPAVPLEDIHALPPMNTETIYYWGFPEDCQPGFWLVEENDETVRLTWRSLDNSAELFLKGRFSTPEVRLPKQTPYRHGLTDSDRTQIRAAWLHVFSANKGTNDSAVCLNGMPLGEIPDNLCYAARRMLLLPPEALATLKRDNEVRLRFPHAPIFAVGSLSLELLLLDGRQIRSRVAPQLFVHGDCPDFAYAKKRAIPVEAGMETVLHLVFDTE